MKILFLPEVENYLFELVKILYEKEYFGFEESALNYIIDLENSIKKDLPTKLKRPTPSHFDKYGKKMLYAVFKKNSTTQWYVFFNIYQEKDEITFLVRYISNNHITSKFL